MISPGGGLVTITPGFMLETSRDLSVTLTVVGLLLLALTVVGLLVLMSPENDLGVLARVVVFGLCVRSLSPSKFYLIWHSTKLHGFVGARKCGP